MLKKGLRKRFCVLVLALFVFTANASPTISYIIPDIAAPGTSVMVEFIGPNSPGNFGADGVYINDPGVEEIRSASPYVVPGPFIVSNSGRVVDAMIFVRPDAPVGTITSCFGVTVNGNPTALPADFTITAVQHIGALSAGGIVGSRSPRGAMLIDSMILSNGIYTLDITDHDNFSLGNQSYLPAIILSRGPIVIKPGATLNVSANNKDGGPGGGGGGGRACDYTGSNYDGGSGYTGGGGGGENPTLGNKTYGLNGGGSGSASSGNGRSMNNTPGGEGGSSCATQGGAGGTGYPFGTSGLVWCSPNPTPTGGIGGGSDGSDGNGGGGGAFSGVAGSGDASNGGQAYGTSNLVPICGGSGGAAGNPHPFLTSACSGDGGGGGGAILLYSRAGITVDGSLLANGANGGPADNPSGGTNGGGGGGAGGGIILSSNSGVIVTGIVNAKGGSGTPSASHIVAGGNGSDGRIRIDDFNSVGGTISPAVGYSGPTLDTIASPKSYVIPFKGTVSNNNGGTVNIYVQRIDGSYQNGSPYSTTVNNGFFQQSIALDSASGSDMYYVTAIRTDGAMPVMGEASGLLVKFSTCPTVTQSELHFPTISACTPASETLHDTISAVPDTLQLSLALGSPAFLLGTTTLLPNNIYREPITFSPPTAGIYYDTLIIHDLNSSSSCPDVLVPLFGISDSVHVQNTPGALNFGTRPLDSTATLWDTITNLSKTVPITIKRIYWNPPDTRISIVKPYNIVGNIIQPSMSLDTAIELQFFGTDPADSTPYNGQLVIVYSDSLCPDDSSMIPIHAKMLVPFITTSVDTLNFGNNASCHDSVMTVTFTNTGNATYHINSVQMPPTSGNLAFTMLTSTASDSIVQGKSKQYSVRFHPLAPDGVKRDSFEIVSNDRPNDLITVYLIGTRVSASYLITPSSVSLGRVNVGSSRSDTVIIRDTGSANLCITKVSIAAPFTLSGTTQKILTPNDTMRLIVTFTPGVTDTSSYTSTVKIISDCPCPDTALITVQGAGANGVPNYSPTSIDFGTLLKCLTKTDTLKLWNDGNAPITIDSTDIPPIILQGGLFSIISGPADGHVLNPGDTIYILVMYDGVSAGTNGPKSGQLYLYTTFNGIQTLTKIPLTATRIPVTQPIITSNAVSFTPAVLVSQFTTMPDTIIDTGSVPIRFLGVQTTPPTDFTATSVPPLPATLNPGDTLVVTIRFAPDSSVTDSTKLITATLQVLYNDTCTGGTDTIPVQLSGRGYKTGASPVVLCFGADTTASIGSVISIPISIDTSLSIFDTLAVTMYVNYDPMVLRILGVTSQCGNTTFSANPTTRIITITLPKCMDTIRQGVIATLQAEVLIGPRNTSTLSIDSAQYSSPYLQNANCPHAFVLTVDTNCSFGLVSVNGANSLAQNYPNPVTGDGQMVTIRYQTVADAHVLLRVFNMLGKEVARLVDGDVLHGNYIVGFDPHRLPNGTYYYTIDAGLYHAARHLIIMR